jgi:hypothetical protein
MAVAAWFLNYGDEGTEKTGVVKKGMGKLKNQI